MSPLVAIERRKMIELEETFRIGREERGGARMDGAKSAFESSIMSNHLVQHHSHRILFALGYGSPGVLQIPERPHDTLHSISEIRCFT